MLLPAARDDVDDARVGVGRVACRRVGHHFDLLDDCGGRLLQIAFLAFLVEMRRAVINPYFNRIHTTQSDVAFGVDFHTGHVLQGIGNSAFLHRNILSDTINHLLAIVHEKRHAFILRKSRKRNAQQDEQKQWSVKSFQNKVFSLYKEKENIGCFGILKKNFQRNKETIYLTAQGGLLAFSL